MSSSIDKTFNVILNPKAKVNQVYKAINEEAGCTAFILEGDHPLHTRIISPDESSLHLRKAKIRQIPGVIALNETSMQAKSRPSIFMEFLNQIEEFVNRPRKR